uniref:Uncharacterized protein n=1 Tax=Anguilla anguilla TaxID=7936 RepID=A0A0E9S6D0_ANGAN
MIKYAIKDQLKNWSADGCKSQKSCHALFQKDCSYRCVLIN